VGATRFRVNVPSVIHETVEAETIIVNLDTGSYYDVNHVGAYILELVERGSARSAVNGLVQELLAEEIIVSENARENGGGIPAGEPVVTPDSRRFVMPVLNKHTDMQDLLLLDPVHEFEGDPPPDVRW
jgi:hypothetical protein